MGVGVGVGVGTLSRIARQIKAPISAIAIRREKTSAKASPTAPAAGTMNSASPTRSANCATDPSASTRASPSDKRTSIRGAPTSVIIEAPNNTAKGAAEGV